MKKCGLAFILLFSGLICRAEALSLPENCFEKGISPCLIRANEMQTLTSAEGDLQIVIDQGTSLKIVDFKSPYKVELLQGQFIVQSKSKKSISFRLNEVSFVSKKVFATINGKRISAYDTKSFILSDYEQSFNPDQETVILKSEFPSKVDMIQFVSKFYPQKPDLFSFLKTIEPAWKKEFKVLTEHQTKALERSVASVQQEQDSLKKQKDLDEAELKNVKKRFFYRTFFR